MPDFHSLYDCRMNSSPTPSLAKRRGYLACFKVPLFLREGFRACPEFISGVSFICCIEFLQRFLSLKSIKKDGVYVQLIRTIKSKD